MYSKFLPPLLSICVSSSTFGQSTDQPSQPIDIFVEAVEEERRIEALPTLDIFSPDQPDQDPFMVKIMGNNLDVSYTVEQLNSLPFKFNAQTYLVRTKQPKLAFLSNKTKLNFRGCPS